MNISTTPIKGLLIIQPRIFGDTRGHFFESYRKDVLMEAGVNVDFVQDNQSLSQKGVLRGLHCQAPPFAQGKLVRVIKGAVLDVAVDVRKDSPTYGQQYSIELSEQNKTMFFLPEGFVHGFLTLEDNTIFAYKCTNYYNKASESGVNWNDPGLNINWNITNPLLSEKDIELPFLKDFVSPF